MDISRDGLRQSFASINDFSDTALSVCRAINFISTIRKVSTTTDEPYLLTLFGKRVCRVEAGKKATLCKIIDRQVRNSGKELALNVSVKLIGYAGLYCAARITKNFR
ncbi:hypothetical protein N9V90_02570 [Endozoicomonas sp.]|nr:hypothetical protein [Endozoicomonas sp.]